MIQSLCERRERRADRALSLERVACMVRISELLQENFVIDDIKATDKDGVLREFAGLQGLRHDPP